MLDLGSIDSGDLDLSTLDRVCDRWTRYPSTRPGDTAARVADADLVVTNKVLLGGIAANIAAFLGGEIRNRVA